MILLKKTVQKILSSSAYSGRERNINDMNGYMQILSQLSGIMSVVGHEQTETEKLLEVTGEYFDECTSDAVGNHIFVKKCGKEGAPKLFLDAHFDAVGLVVTSITKEGNLKVTRMGGVDRKILPAAEVTIHAKNGPVYGIIATTPPHLMTPEDRSKVTDIENMIIDTGYSKKTLEEEFGVRIGTPVSFGYGVTELLNDRAAGPAFDDKACVAAVIRAMQIMKESGAGSLFDIYFAVSAEEETGMSGAAKAAFAVKPDLALVLDVGFATSPDTPAKNGASDFGSGVIISYSAVTNIKLARKIIKICDDNEVKYTVSVEPSGTGTNGDNVTLVEGGIPTAVLGMPLRSMHTYSEVVDPADGEELAKLVTLIMKDSGLEAWCHE